MKLLCKYGHSRVGNVKPNGQCKTCAIEQSIRWFRTPKGQAARQRCKTKHGESWRLSRYGLTVEQYSSMLLVQNNRCAICEKVTSSFHIDHNHTTGKVRGLLCWSCNVRVVPVVEHNLSLLEKVKAYIQI